VATYFVDTSALVKRYLPERGSDRMDSLFQQNAEIHISSLTLVEFLSNLQRLRSVDRVISDSQFNEAWVSPSLEVAAAKIRVLGAMAEVIDCATQLLLTRYLTPIDALQVATAKSAAAGVADVIVVSSDRAQPAGSRAGHAGPGPNGAVSKLRQQVVGLFSGWANQCDRQHPTGLVR